MFIKQNLSLFLWGYTQKVVKKVALTLIVLATLSPSFGQYESMLKSGAIWRWEYKYGGFLSIPLTSTYYYFKILNDTSINTTLYKKSNYSVFLREDSGGRVYLLDYTGIENLLYDFSMDVGDSIRSCHRNTIGSDTDYTYFHVVKTDSIYLNGRYLKRLKFKEKDPFFYNEFLFDTVTWIEGIGNLHHPLAMNYYPCEACGRNVMCYTSLDLEWESDAGQCQYLGIEGETDENPIECSPNPFMNEITIDCDVESIKLLIYNSSGNLMMEKNVRCREKTELSLPAKGLYLFKLYKDDKFVGSNKLIKY